MDTLERELCKPLEHHPTHTLSQTPSMDLHYRAKDEDEDEESTRAGHERTGKPTVERTVFDTSADDTDAPDLEVEDSHPSTEVDQETSADLGPRVGESQSYGDSGTSNQSSSYDLTSDQSTKKSSSRGRLDARYPNLTVELRL